MTTLVRFRVAGSSYAAPVGQTREIRPAGELVPLATSRPGVAGLLSWHGEALSVVSLLGEGGRQVMVLDDGGEAFGLLVDEVEGVVQLGSEEPGPAPRGQAEELVSGTARTQEGELMLLVDVGALGGWLRR